MSKKPTKKGPVDQKTVCENRKGRFEYHIEERFEAGVVLTGSEVKSLRQGKANITNAYADLRQNELYLFQAHITPYDKGGYANHEPERKRKLLLHREEIERLIGKIQTKGFTLIPLKMYFKKHRVKIEIGLGIGKKDHDKRATIKERETKRQLERTLRKFR